MNTKNYLTPTKKYKTLLSAVHSVFRLVNSTFLLKDLVSRLTRLICQIFNAHYCIILLLDPTKKYSILKCAVNGKKKILIDKRSRISNRLELKVLKSLSSIRTHDTLAIPLVSEDIIGLIVVKKTAGQAHFERNDQEVLMAMIEQGIIGIKNLQMYEEQQKIVLGSIKALVTILDLRVPREYAHSPYFGRLVSATARQMRLDEKQIESLKYATLLHDTGKANIPLEILTKTAKLTEDEFNIVQHSSLRGAEILRPLQVLKPVVPILMHHHEKFDGTGYPSRLKKGQIPIGARIMSVADAFEAMVYGRPYKERMGFAQAIKEIKRKSGTQFDPKVVEAFLQIVKRLDSKKYLNQAVK